MWRWATCGRPSAGGPGNGTGPLTASVQLMFEDIPVPNNFDIEKSESYSYLSGELAAGEHVIAFRTYDQNDNAGMGKLVVRIP